VGERESKQLQEVAEFRDRLIAYMNLVQQHVGTYRFEPVPDNVETKLATEQSWLGMAYGKLFKVINRWGGMQMTMPAIGITSHDVIADAINDIADASYSDLARFSVQHLNTTIGRLAAEIEDEENETAVDGSAIYQFTSPVFWIVQLLRLIRWLVLTSRGRIVGAVGAIVLVVIGGLVSGWAEAFFARMLAGQTPAP
jgi:hypothetical protein